jgi:serine protease Do
MVLRSIFMIRIFLLNIIFAINLFSTTLPDLQKEVNNIVEKTNKAVVSVRVFKEGYLSVVEPEFFFDYMIPEEKIYKYKVGGIGSGVIISEDGYIVTNYHVIEYADEVKVEMYESNKKTSYTAKFIGGDKKIDIAIIKINSSRKFPYLSFSTKNVSVGDIVFAIGYPFGFKQTYTMGIISAKNVSLKVEGKTYNDLLQTDAAINQGNSGGPLVNIYGEIVGINTAIYSPSGAFAGIGFTIPGWRVKEIVDEVIYSKTPKRGWIGVSLIPTDLIMRNVMLAGEALKGGIINKVYKDSPAQKAGLKRGDIIISVDGDEVENDEELVSKIYYKKPGDTVSITYMRDGKKYTTNIILGTRPKEDEIVKLDSFGDENNDISKLKTKSQKNNERLFEFKGLLLKYQNGSAYVVKVEKNSPFANYVQKDDIISSVNGKKFNNHDEMVNVFNSINLSDGVLFDISRDGEPFYLSVQVK